MPIDVTRLIGAVKREVTTREKEGASLAAVSATRRFDTTVEDLWDAVTHPDRVARWFLPLSGQLRPGGRFQLEGNAGGEIVECDPPTRLALTWEWQEQVSWVTAVLAEEDGGGSRLRVEHSWQLPDEMWEEYGPGAAGVGWDQLLFGLDQEVTQSVSVRPEDAEAWAASAEGRSFIEQSSDAWCAAWIDSGTDPESARMAARRTTAAYLGDDPDTTSDG